jgi:UDP-3-O-[3-hydroxymyristoyl] glucosamine N-acyltransferase
VAVSILTALFDPGPAHADGIHPAAVVSPDASLGAGVSIGPGAVVGPRSVVGAGTVILPQATIGADVTLGRDCVIQSGVRIGDRVRLGGRVIVHFNTAIGCDGFSFIPVRNPDGTPGAEGMPRRIHSLGTVVIGDDVEIGAGTTIDRATLRETRIGRGTKIDNQVQIAHNVTIGESCLICGMVGIAGSVTIGDRTIVAAGAGIADHVQIGENAVITAGAAVATRVPAGGMVTGVPAIPHDTAVRRFADIGRLRTLYPRVDELKKRVEALEKAAKGG